MALIRYVHGTGPVIAPSARIAETAALIGSVELKEGANIWYGAVLRGDGGTITIGTNSAVEDNCVLHGRVTLGEDCIVGHGAVLHHCTLGPRVLVGMGAVILSGAVIGEDCVIAAGAVVPERTVIPPGSAVMGVPGKVKHRVPETHREEMRNSAAYYVDLAADQLPGPKKE